MSTQGPIVVATGADGGEGAAIWTNPANAHSSSSGSVAQMSGSLGPAIPTNTLKAQFNAAAFSVTGNVSQIQISFNAFGGASNPIRIKSIKTSLTGSTDLGDLATITGSDAQYTYTFTGLAIAAATINGAWEIDLRFDDGTAGSAFISVYKVSATVTYPFADEDIDSPAVINGSIMCSCPGGYIGE